MTDTPIRIGGLMRCCIQTLKEYDGEENPGETKLRCRYCGEAMRLVPGPCWEWDNP